MYIVGSKIKDYYDTAIGQYGIDKSCVYVRETKDIGFNKVKTYFDLTPASHGITGYRNYNDELVISAPFIIGFCGKLYVGYYTEYEKKSKVFPYDPVYERIITYDTNEIAKVLNVDISRNFHLYSLAYRHMQFMEKFNGKIDDKLFIEHNTPIFVMDYGSNLHGFGRGSQFVINPVLKDYEFFRVFDSFRTFQEISLYIGNVLTKPDEPKQLDDKYRLIQHGFDKNSFRQVSPGQKKEKRLANKAKKRNGQSIKSK